MKKFIGVDLGGTNLRAGIVNLDAGTVLAMKSVLTLAREGHDTVMQRMADLILDVIISNKVNMTEIDGIGIGVPGVLDLEKGTTLFSPNLPDN
jgi:glucokinase